MVVLADHVVIVGDDDDVLDPGEQWSYEAVLPALEPILVEATAETPGGSPVSDVLIGASLPFPDSLAFPVELSIVAEPTTAVAGRQVRWAVTAHNIASFPIVALDDGIGEWRLLHPDQPTGSFTPLGAPTDGGDGDAVLSPDETWRWEVDQVVTVDGSSLELNLTVGRGDLDGLLGLVLSASSAPIAVVSPATTAPATTVASPPGATGLPETGVDRTLVGVALCLLVLGAVAVRVARSSPVR